MAETTKKGVLLYVYTSTPLQQYQYVPKETVRHQASCEEVYTYVYPVSLAARYRVCVSISPVDTLAGRGDAGQDAAAATALLGDYHSQVTGPDFRRCRHRLGAQGGLCGACFRLSQ